jgi:heat shock protein HslJ
MIDPRHGLYGGIQPRSTRTTRKFSALICSNDTTNMAVGAGEPAERPLVRLAADGVYYRTSEVAVRHISLARWSAFVLGGLVVTGLSNTPAAARITGPVQGSSAPPAFAGTEWRLTHLGNRPVTSVNAKVSPTLLFDAKTSRFSGSGGCNRISGTFTHKGGSLTFGAVVSTRMACPGGIMNVEIEFTKALTQVRTWRLVGRTLQLMDGDARALARLESSATTRDTGERPSFANKVWKVEKSTGVQPGLVYVFLSDGTLLITSGTSIPTLGRWTFDGTTLTMIEEGIAHKVDLLAQSEDRLSIRIHSAGPPLDISMVRVTTSGPVK